MDVVREQALAVELDDRKVLAICRLELCVAADVDLAELEAELRPQLRELRARPLAEVAVLRVVEGDDGYG